LDAARAVAGCQERIESDLRWLGLDWDIGPIHQSGRGALYENAIALLRAKGLIYPCDCSRAEIARVASAPHAGEESVYPGFCRHRDPSRAMKRPPALRVVVPWESVSYVDGVVGPISQELAREVGDFVVQRGDGSFAYQLAVVVDDASMAVSHVVRGADLIASTPRQIWLARMLDLPVPQYFHVPVVLASDGTRLEKRAAGATVRALREAGLSRDEVVGVLACGLGLRPSDAPIDPTSLARELSERGIACAWRQRPWTMPAAWATFSASHKPR
jgi:glutamyl-tRNA synthetase